ncbi:MAG: histidine kinase [Planctomycetota bacterium]|jgi:signal transduction histidine kinase
MIIYLTSSLIAILSTSAIPAESFTQLEDLTLIQLEQRLTSIDSDLEQLAHYSLRSGIGPVGYRSKTYDDSTNTEWIQIDLGEEIPIDQIVLVPTIWRDTEKGFIADGFPLEFNITAGNHADPNGTVIALFGVRDRLLPRIAPLAIPCASTTASWIRIEATALSTRAWDGKYILQFDEIMVFKGQENMALNQPVQASSPGDPAGFPRRIQYLVDGFVPYLMDACLGDQSIAYLSAADVGDQPTLTIDLETVRPLNRIHLHAVDLSDTVPISTPIGFGVPQRLRIEGAMRPDFSDAVRLIDYHKQTVYDTGPIIMRRFPETSCRYVRLVAVEPDIDTRGLRGPQIGFAEIEIFSQSRNVALGKAVHSDLKPLNPDRSLTALTDGCNLYGRILPIRTWMNELARRHDLETVRPVVVAELNRRYARQRTQMRYLSGLAVVLVLGTIIIVLVDRIIKQRAINQIREHIAADLHDELGANLHAIGLLSDLALNAKDTPEKLANHLKRLRALTERTGLAARYCTNSMEAERLCENLLEDMQRTSSRILADLEHSITFEGEEWVQRIKPRRRVDLFLFYKECLTNILRHSNATRVKTKFEARQELITLIVTDNGQGLRETKGNGVPTSLKRRARLLGAQVSAGPSASGGACITLKLRL